MKELLTVARNFLTTFDEDEKPIKQAEIVLVMSEAVYNIDAGGEMVRSRETSQIRFVARVENLRKLSDILRTFADEAEKDGPAVPASAVPVIPQP